MPSLKNINPLAPETVECPYDFYKAARAEQPVFKPEGADFFIVTRYEDIDYIIAHPEIFSSRMATGYRPSPEARQIMAQGWLPIETLLTNDPPAHRRFRGLVNKAFTPKRVALLEPAIRAIADNLIDRFIDKGQAEFIAEFAVPLPLTVIADALGVSRDDMPKFKRWSDDAVAPIGKLIDHERELECARSGVEFQKYFAERLDEHRENPRDDILSDLINARLDNERPLDTREMLNMLQQLLVAGNETTTNLIGNAMMILLQSPEQLGALRSQPSMIPTFIEEALRFESPVQGLSRVTKVDTELGGVKIPAGSQLVLMYGSANRDERHFAGAENFDMRRENVREHFAFGGGIHYCLGAPLARTEARIAFELLLNRLDSIRPAPGLNDFTHVPSVTLRGLKKLHIEFERAH